MAQDISLLNYLPKFIVLQANPCILA